MFPPDVVDFHDPDQYSDLVDKLATEVEERREKESILHPDEILNEVAEGWLFNEGVERAAFVAKNSPSEPGEYEPFIGDGSASSQFEAIAITQLRQDVRSELRSRDTAVPL